MALFGQQDFDFSRPGSDNRKVLDGGFDSNFSFGGGQTGGLDPGLGSFTNSPFRATPRMSPGGRDQRFRGSEEQDIQRALFLQAQTSGQDVKGLGGSQPVRRPAIMADSGGATPPGAPGSLIPGTGPGFPGKPAQFVGGGGGGGGGRGVSPFANWLKQQQAGQQIQRDLAPFLAQLQAKAQEQLDREDFGLPEDVLRDQRNALVATSGQVQNQALQQAAGAFNSRGTLKSGISAGKTDAITRQTSEAVANALSNLALQDAQFANEGRRDAFSMATGIQSLASQTALGAGQLDLTGLVEGGRIDEAGRQRLSNQFIEQQRLSLQEMLGNQSAGLQGSQIALQRELGLGDLGLREQQFLFNSNLTSQLQNLMARQGLGQFGG